MLYGLERTAVRLRIPANTHLESWRQPCNIASQLSFLHQLNVILSWSRAVISPPTLTRFWYRRAHHVFNGLKAVWLKALFFVDFHLFSVLPFESVVKRACLALGLGKCFNRACLPILFGGMSQRLYKTTVPKRDICKHAKLICLACFSSPPEFLN